MAINIKLDDLLHDRRMTLTDLADRIGMTLANLSILKTGKARAVRFSTLNAICGALSCQPGDILRFEPDAEGKPAPNEENINETPSHSRQDKTMRPREAKPITRLSSLLQGSLLRRRIGIVYERVADSRDEWLAFREVLSVCPR